MATEQLTDQEKDFRRRARRRLIGAVALVLLMVTVLPMLLDDRSDQNMPAADVAISIPSQDDTGFTSKIVPVTPAVTAKPAPAAPMAPIPEPSASASPAPLAAPAIPAQPAKVIEKPSTQAAAAQPIVQMEPPLAPAAKESPKKADKADPPVTQKVTPKKGMVSVQIGVFSDAAKVKQVQAKIAALGLKSGIETLNTPTGPKLRMRSGPYDTRADAEQALETLKGAGFSPILVMH